jgi:predicted nucleotidyltransferase
MITGSKAEIAVLRVFCAEPFRYFSVQELAKRVKILEELGRNEMLLKERKVYRLNYSNILCKRLKLLFDSEFVLSLDIGKRILRMVERIVYECSPDSVVLVGSAAVGKHVGESDVDFLVIASKKEVPLLDNVNVVVMNRRELERKFMKGDDFIVSALSRGRVVYDKEDFINFYTKPLPVFSSEVIREKIETCEKLRDRAYNLLRVNAEKGSEEVLNLAIQCARVIPLKKGVIPGVKREIVKQIKSENKRLSEIIENLMNGEKVEKGEVVDYLRFCSELISEF